MSVIELGESIPAVTPHAVSVSLPTWSDNVGYEEGQKEIINKLTTGYPRFFIHKLIVAFAEEIAAKYGAPSQQAMLFPTAKTARRCMQFIRSNPPADSSTAEVRVVDLVLDRSKTSSELLLKISPCISAVLFPSDIFSTAKQYWQHSGDGVQSRRAEFCHALFQEGTLVEATVPQPPSGGAQKAARGPRRYQKVSVDKKSFGQAREGSESPKSPVTTVISEARESSQFLEERFGRNLDASLVGRARSSICRRIAGSLMDDAEPAVEFSAKTTLSNRGVADLAEDDVYLYPCGMNSIFNTHNLMLQARGQLKTICFGFTYVDTLKILEKFGPGCQNYGNGASEDLDDLEARLKAGERFLALFCEFPSNPLLKCPDLERIRKLADAYDFAVVVDETVGNFINVHVLPYADVVVSSLTKVFSGECNVMGGASILNPQGRYYSQLKKLIEAEYEDNYWIEDVIFLERNSRHFVSRIEKINENAEVICDVLRTHPLVKAVYYPKYNDSKAFYDECRTPKGGYGGLLSCTFHKTEQAIAFFDRIETAKGPSLGTNFTLTSPYVILAHFQELEWVAQFGVPFDLIRVSVGLEDAKDLKARFEIALKAAEAVE
ncbi:cystathionine gamma-synthase-like protein [Calycina marina]|uniref:cystathionine gamma-synthase n=1 Tax=Calycina marina TaxID=1763456 RepID=A0A9P7ZBJ2_9HELO|nr:cystathionine gamma-synthase-like protein [Calycina marina]